MIQAARAGFMAKGMDAYTATRQAYAALFGMVQQHASMVSFVSAFRLLGIMFVCVVPLILLMKKPRHKAGPAPTH